MSMPAGWYDDGSGRQRWWDGQKWTDQFASGQSTSASVLPAPQRSRDGSSATASPARVNPILGFIGLGLAVLGTLLACIPVTFIVGVAVLVAAFGVSLIGLFKKRAARWPSIVGLILAIAGGSIRTVVTLVVVAANLPGPDLSSAPTASHPSHASEEPVSPMPSESSVAGKEEGRPSAEVIAELSQQVIRDSGTTAYDDMPEFFPCVGQELYSSSVDDETLWLLIRGADSLGPGQAEAERALADAVLTCDPNGEGAWG